MKSTCLALLIAVSAWSQTPAPPPQQDAQRTREEFHELLQRHPPALREVFVADPALLTNQAYLAPYPALASFVTAHPEVVRNPAYFVGTRVQRTDTDRMMDSYQEILGGLAALTAGSMIIGLLAWLVRTAIDYRRWSRATKIQAEVHTKLLDRLTSNDELLAYLRSPAGERFLESAPITLDAAPRRLSAPVARILWSLQGGVVLMAAGLGLSMMSRRIPHGELIPLQALGVLAACLGGGFIISAGLSYLISRRLGLFKAAHVAEG